MVTIENFISLEQFQHNGVFMESKKKLADLFLPYIQKQQVYVQLSCIVSITRSNTVLFPGNINSIRGSNIKGKEVCSQIRGSNIKGKEVCNQRFEKRDGYCSDFFLQRRSSLVEPSHSSVRISSQEFIEQNATIPKLDCSPRKYA